jgi:hypothetical protein
MELDMAETSKHPKDMTTEEAVSHLFDPKVVEHAKKQAEESKKPRPKKSL